MATTVKLSENIIAEANSDLSYEFLKSILIAQKEVKAGKVKKYTFEKE